MFIGIGFQPIYSAYNPPITITYPPGWGVGPANAAAATALLTRMTTASAARRTQVGNALDTVGDALANLDFWHMLNGEDATQAALNWVQNAFNLTKTGTAAFVAGQGYQSDGTTGFLSTGFNPTAAAGKFSLNDATLSVMVLEPWISGSGNKFELGAGTAFVGGTSLTEAFVALNSAARIGSTPGNAPLARLAGLHTLVRRSSTTVDYYIGSVKLGSYPSTSSALPNAVLTLLGLAGASLSTRRVAAAFAGKALSDAQVAQMNAAIMADMRATGGLLYDYSVRCIGNSLTLGTGSTTPATDAYPVQLAALYGANVDVQGFGYGGKTTPLLIEYLGTTAQATTSESLSGAFYVGLRAGTQFPAKKRIAVVWEIRNHMAVGNATPQQAIDALSAICAKLRAMGAADRIVVLNAIPDGSGAAGFTPTLRNQVNSLLAAQYTSFADVLVDVGSAPNLQNTANTTYFAADALHLTTLSYHDEIAPRVKIGVDAAMAMG